MIPIVAQRSEFFFVAVGGFVPGRTNQRLAGKWHRQLVHRSLSSRILSPLFCRSWELHRPSDYPECPSLSYLVHYGLSSGFENTIASQNVVKCGFDTAYLDRIINQVKDFSQSNSSTLLTLKSSPCTGQCSVLRLKLEFEYQILLVEQLYFL